MTACWPGCPTIAKSSPICSLRPENRLRRSIGAAGRNTSPTSRRRSWTSASGSAETAIQGPCHSRTADTTAPGLAPELLLLPFVLLVLPFRLLLDRLLRRIVRRRVVTDAAG